MCEKAGTQKMVGHCFKEDYNIWFSKTKYVKDYCTNVLCRSQMPQMGLKKTQQTTYKNKTETTQPKTMFVLHTIKTPNYSESRHLPAESSEPRN